MTGFPKGSEWRKWDLHVHTPLSIVQHYEGLDENDRWEKFIQDLEALPTEFKVLGINDYLFIDGYEKVLEYRRHGRLKNIDTIFPVIEFRVKKFGGHRVFKRVNFHVIFSDKIPVETLKQQFLNQLYGKYTLTPGNEALQWQGFITRESLADLGNKIKASVPADKIADYGSDLEEGFNNINFDEEEIVAIIQRASTYLGGKFLTAIGKTEWDAFAWDDGSIAEKKTVINKVDFVFTSAENITSYNNAKKKLEEQNVNNLLLDCSDAHRNSTSIDKDRIGKCFTWIKADPTFEGLKQVRVEKDRVCVAAMPELLQRLQTNPNKFITKAELKRIDNCPMSEIWFDNLSLELNPSLVAVIGNKGNGKSALTDIMGLIGNSYNESYSFLTKKKFRNPKPYNKASMIEAKITWKDGAEDGFTTLDSSIDLGKPEKVKYIPQNFLEELCVNEDDYEFEEEIKKIIFAHTDPSEKSGYSSLDDMMKFKTEVIHRELGIIKTEVDEINSRIISLERKTQESYKRRLVESLQEKEEELRHHRENRPIVVAAPNTDPDQESKASILNKRITELKDTIATKNARAEQISISRTALIRDISVLEKSSQAIKSITSFHDNIVTFEKKVLASYDIDISNVVQLTVDVKPIEDLIDAKNQELQSLKKELDGDGESVVGITNGLEKLRIEVVGLEEQLDEPQRLYRKYVNDLETWTRKEQQIIGNSQSVGTIEALKSDINYLETQLNADLNGEIAKRNISVKKLYDKKSEILSLYQNAYKPITDFIVRYKHLMKEYDINLSAEFALDGFTEKFFDHVSQGSKGTFIGIEEGNKALADMINTHEFNDGDGIVQFVNDIRDSLYFDKRTDQNSIQRDIELQIKKGYSIHDLYSFLFGLEYLKPSFKLNLGTKTLSELSPGERGALLLIFYLFLDKEDKPLIIDQPEENLDNQSVYNYLVHFIKEAKKRRQIIIVTHNPNLAVVCDAEQVIHMAIDKTNNNTVSYIAGSIEDRTINKAIIDILEGTKPAFNNRTDKYSLAI